MTRRITCYVVFVTLIWGAHTDDEGKLRDMFKSNMTRNDFSNLLQSLIKLNEQRVSVLQKLYRLEDYGVLSEVLRSGDKKTENGNPSNLYLIVMSKNQNEPSRREIAFQLVDSVSSLNVGSNNNYSKLDFVLDPAGYFTQSKENSLLDSIFGNIPRVEPTEKHRVDDGSKKISITKETLKFNKPGQRTEVKHDSNVSRAATSQIANEEGKFHKENRKYEIVNNKGRRPKTNEKVLGYDGNRKHSQTVGYNSQSNEYVEKDFTIENEKLTTKPNITKHIITSNYQNSKYPSKGKDEDDYGSPFSHVNNDQNRQYTKLISDISIKKYHSIYHYNPKTNKYTPKVKVPSNQQNDKLTTKPITIKDIITNNHKYTKYPLEGKDELEEDDYASPSSNKLTTKLITIKARITSNHKYTKYPLEGKDELEEDVYTSPSSNIENGHYSQYSNKNSDVSIKKHHVNNHKTNKYTRKVKVQSKQQNDKLTTKPITVKYVSTGNLPNPWYPLEANHEEDYGSPFSNLENDHYSQYANINSDIPKLHVSNHEGKDELEEDNYGSSSSNIENYHFSQYTNKNSDISIKKIHVNNHNNPKAIENTPKENILRNRHPKLNQNTSKLNNQGNKYSKIKAVKNTIPNYKYLDHIINGTVKKASGNNQVIKNPNLNHNNTNTKNDDLTSIEDEYATQDTKLPSLAIENTNGSKPVISEITKTQNERYPDFEDHKDIRDNKQTNKGKLKTAKDTPFENYPGFETLKILRENSNKDKPETTTGTPVENNFHGFEHHNNVMKNLNNHKPNTVKELHQRDNPNVILKNDTDYYGVKMVDTGKSGEEFSVFITNVGNRTAEEVKEQKDTKLTLNAFHKPRNKQIARKPFAKCLNKRALKLCSKSCISAYKNVCRKLKCTSRSKRALKSECKRSCKKTFASSSSKYSDKSSSSGSSSRSSTDESDRS